MVTMNKVLGHMLKSLTKNHVEHIGGPELVCAFALNLLKSPRLLLLLLLLELAPYCGFCFSATTKI